MNDVLVSILKMACASVYAHHLENCRKIDLCHNRSRRLSFLQRGTQQWSLPSFNARPASFQIQNGDYVTMMIQWRRSVRWHFVTLVKSDTHLIECNPGYIRALINAIINLPSLFWKQIFNFFVSYWLTETLYVRHIPLKMCDGPLGKIGQIPNRLNSPWEYLGCSATSRYPLANPVNFFCLMSSLPINLKFVKVTCAVLTVIRSKNTTLSFSHLVT